MGKRQIPPKYEEKIMSLYEDGVTTRDIADILAKEDGIECSDTTVWRLIAQKKEERQQATQAVYAKAAKKHAFKDLDIINEVIDTLNSKYQDAFAKGDVKTADALLNTLLKFQSKRMSLSGLGQTTDDMDDAIEEVKADLLKKLPN